MLAEGTPQTATSQVEGNKAEEKQNLQSELTTTTISQTPENQENKKSQNQPLQNDWAQALNFSKSGFFPAAISKQATTTATQEVTQEKDRVTSYTPGVGY